MTRYVCIAVGLSGLFLCGSCFVSGMVLDQLTDPVEKCLAPFLDIIEARVEGDEGDLMFIMRMRGTLPIAMPTPNDTLMFVWLIDADCNPNTGQDWNKLGVDFKVSARIGQRNGGGVVDVVGDLPGGGTGTIFINQDTIRISIRAGQVGFPNEFDWRVTSAATINEWFVSGNNISAMGSTVTLPNVPPFRIEVFPPMLCFSSTGQSTGRLSVRLFDEYGLQMPTDRYTVQYISSDPALAGVDSTGMVSIQPGATECDRPVWISAAVDGLESINQVLVRQMDGPLPIGHRLWSQKHIGLYMPLETTGSDLERFVDSVRAADVMESVYCSQRDLSGTVIYQDGIQYLIVENGDCGNPTSCSTGNPIRLDWKQLMPPAEISELADSTDISWVKVFHDMGHNYLAPSAVFRQMTTAASANHNTAYAEAMATAEAMWSRYRLIRCGGGLGQFVLEEIEKEYAIRERGFRNRLLVYQANGKPYDQLDADVLLGILCEIHDEFGDKAWFDLFSTLLPEQETFPVEITTRQRQATWFVAALSASTGQDLRERFATRYGFAIDTQIWETTLLAAQTRISARPWQPDNPADLNCDQQVWLEDLWQMADHWMRTDCAEPWWCGHSDLDRNGRVDLSDIDTVSNQWLWTNCLPLTLP